MLSHSANVLPKPRPNAPVKSDWVFVALMSMETNGNRQQTAKIGTMNTNTNANGHMNFQPRQSRLCLFTRAKGDTLTDVMPLSFEGLEAKHTAQNLPQRNSSLNLFREMHAL